MHFSGCADTRRAASPDSTGSVKGKVVPVLNYDMKKYWGVDV
jgi:hypothetical protein